MEKLIEGIRGSSSNILSHPTFKTWAEPIKWEEGDLLVLNNSFVFRDVKTTKAEEYLAYGVDKDGAFSDLCVANPGRIISDFKRIPKKAVGSVKLTSLEEQVREQHSKLGNLVYLLVGEVDDSKVQTVRLSVNPFESVTWDPKLQNNCQVVGTEILLRETFDEEDLWKVIIQHTPDETDKEELKQQFGAALDQLQDMAMAELRLPEKGKPITHGVTAAICEILKNEKSDYAAAVANLPDPKALNEVLRIAYNFASDATNYMRLIVSICDLKPIVLWGTISEHYSLSEKFKKLPWARRNKKPSLRNYESTIKDARNSAFHNLFPFRKSLSVQLPIEALGKAELRIFSEHSKKKENSLNYMDKPLVDVLVGFTRAREVRVAERFWKKNIELMDATISLFEATDSFLRHSMQSKLDIGRD
jgi:hypothetical protein